MEKLKFFKYVLLIVLLGVVLFALYLANYLGAFKPVTISEVEMGPLKVIYLDHEGAYHKIVPKIEEVETWAKENKIPCEKSFGEYLDNPNNIDEERLRSLGGCIVEDFPKNIPTRFKQKEFPARKYIQAHFEGSPGIGPMKVYPKAQKYMSEKNLKQSAGTIEIYQVISDKEMITTYLFPY